MRTGPETLPIFRSAGQARLLACLMIGGCEEWRSLSDLARSVDLTVSSVQREVARLTRSGLVESRRVGNVRQVRADRTSPFFPALRALIVKASGAGAPAPRRLRSRCDARPAGRHRPARRGHAGPRPHPPASGDVAP